MKKLIIILYFCCFGILVANAQMDTAFWFAPPDIEEIHQQVPIRFCFSTYDEPATVVLEQPANGAFVPVTFNIPANSFYVYDVSDLLDEMETKPINTVLNNGVHISSTTLLSCYYECVGNNSEIYTLKGENALGTDFLVPMQTEYPNYYATSPSSIEIVATEDNTVVQIKAPVALRGGIAAGSTITVTLNRGQSYSIRSDGTSGAAHLHNTVIHSNKPIAVSITDDSVYVPVHADLVGEQLVPISLLGTRYVALRNNSNYERLFIFPVENQTTVSINGAVQQVLNTGQWINYSMSSGSVAYLIEADKPIAVFQLTAIGGEMGGTMLPQMECTGSNKVSHHRPNPSTTNTSMEVITVVVATENISEFQLNGNSNVLTAADFSPIPADPSWSYCVKDISSFVSVNSVMTLRNDAGRFLMGIMDGVNGNGCSYGYFSNYNANSYLRLDMDTLFCEGGDIAFQYSALNVSEITLTTPSGQQLTGPPFVLSNASATMSGLYTISGVDTTGCLPSYADSVFIHVESCADLDTMTVTICESDAPFLLNSNAYWQSGVFTHHLYGSDGGDSIIILQLTVLPQLMLNHTPDTVVSSGTAVTLWASGTENVTWLDTNGVVLGVGSTLSFTAERSTTVYLEGTTGANLIQNGDFEQGESMLPTCSVLDSIYITVTDTCIPMQLAITSTSDTICSGDEVVLHAEVDVSSTPGNQVSTVAIGDILCTDSSIVKPSAWPVAGKTAMGIVFYVDNTDEHGWAVHLQDQGTLMQWTVSGSPTDISTLTNYTNAREAITDLNGYDNTQRIRAAGNATTYPAAYAVDFENGWYLPAAGQLRILYSMMVIVNASLQTVGGTQLPMDSTWWYWSSTEYGQSSAWLVLTNGGVGDDRKYLQYSVRSVRAF